MNVAELIIRRMSVTRLKTVCELSHRGQDVSEVCRAVRELEASGRARRVTGTQGFCAIAAPQTAASAPKRGGEA